MAGSETPGVVSANEQALVEENHLLREAVERLTERIDRLEKVIETGHEEFDQGQGIRIPKLPHGASRLSRRSLLSGAAATGALAAAAGLVVSPGRAAAAMSSRDTVLHQFMDFNSAHLAPSLISDVTWTRQDPSGVSAGETNEILSLVSDNSQTNSYPYALYIELRGTTSGAATLSSSQSVGSYVKSFNRSTGSPWLAAFHSEPHHGENESGMVVTAEGTSIGYNCELNRQSVSGLAIGLEIQNVSTSTANGDHAIEIRSTERSVGITNAWENGLHFQGAGTSDPDGNIGINMTNASYLMGIDLGPNSFRFNSNQMLLLNGSNAPEPTFIRFNSKTGNVEIVKNGVLVASF